MNKEKQFLLDVLKSFVHQEKMNFDVEVEWRSVLHLSSIHSVAGILGYMAMKNPCERTSAFADALKKKCLVSISIFVQRSENDKGMIKKLNDAGIDHILSKGYILRDYYPVPELRSYGDVDILIKPEDRKKCHKLMLEQGFSVKIDWEPVFSYYKDTELYEIHTRMMEIDVSDKADYKGYFNKAWEHTINIGEHSFEPTPEFHFIYLLAHIAKHIRGSGAGIRMYMDLAVFIMHFGDSIDWAYIDCELTKLKLKDFANTALNVVERYFDITSPIELHKINDKTFEDFMDYTMDGGVFGYFGRDRGLIALKNTEHKSRIATIMHRLFPPAENIESRYTYLQDKHWLLPFAWAHRFFKTRDTWDKHKKEAKSIMHTDDKEVEKLKCIYKEIGL